MKKFLNFFILTLLIFLSNSIAASALTSSTVNIDSIYHSDVYKNGNYFTTSTSIGRLYVDGLLTYCIEPHKSFFLVNDYIETNYEDVGLTRDQVEKMSLYAYYGYGYSYLPHSDNNWYLATQELIREVLGYNTVWNHGNLSTTVYKNEIQTLVNNHRVVPSFTKEILLREGDKITLTDENNVLKYFEVTNSGGYKVEKNGNSLTIDSDRYRTHGIVTLTKGRDKYYDGTRIFKRYNSQSVLSFGLFDEVNVVLNIRMMQFGKIRIIKKDVDTNEVLQGVSFLIKDKDDNILEELVTNEEGVAVSSEYLYGTYYVLEKSAKEGYIIDSEIKEVVINDNFNELSVANKKIKNNVVITKKDTATKEVLEGAVFSVFNSDGNLIESTVTNSDGEAHFELFAGKYYYREVAAPSGYIIDNNNYEFSVDKENVILEFDSVNDKFEMPRTSAPNKVNYAVITLLLACLSIKSKKVW